MKRLTYIIILVAVLWGCNKKDGLEFNPPAQNTTTPYTFSIGDGASRINYSLKSYTALMNLPPEGYTYYTFLLKGHDDKNNVDVVIGGKVISSGEMDIDVSIGNENTSTFYKDVNNQYVEMTEGSDSRGRYIRLNQSRLTMLTTELASERHRISTVPCRFDNMTFYVPDEKK